jgi:hypothetical protein
MSMINKTSIEGNTMNGCSLWQLGNEFQLHQAVGTRDDYHRWRSAAASRGVAFDNELRMAERYADVDDDDDDGRCRKFRFSDVSLKFSEMKIQHPFHGQQLPDKWYKTLPPAEMLPRNEVLGGFIFVCNNETMQEDLRRQLFGNFSTLVVILLSTLWIPFKLQTVSFELNPNKSGNCSV